MDGSIILDRGQLWRGDNSGGTSVYYLEGALVFYFTHKDISRVSNQPMWKDVHSNRFEETLPCWFLKLRLEASMSVFRKKSKIVKNKVLWLYSDPHWSLKISPLTKSRPKQNQLDMTTLFDPKSNETKQQKDFFKHLLTFYWTEQYLYKISWHQSGCHSWTIGQTPWRQTRACDCMSSPDV